MSTHLDEIKTFNFFDKWFYFAFALMCLAFTVASKNYVWLMSVWLSLVIAQERYIKYKNSNSPK